MKGLEEWISKNMPDHKLNPDHQRKQQEEVKLSRGETVLVKLRSARHNGQPQWQGRVGGFRVVVNDLQDHRLPRGGQEWFVQIQKVIPGIAFAVPLWTKEQFDGVVGEREIEITEVRKAYCNLGGHWVESVLDGHTVMMHVVDQPLPVPGTTWLVDVNGIRKKGNLYLSLSHTVLEATPLRLVRASNFFSMLTVPTGLFPVVFGQDGEAEYKGWSISREQQNELLPGHYMAWVERASISRDDDGQAVPWLQVIHKDVVLEPTITWMEEHLRPGRYATAVTIGLREHGGGYGCWGEIEDAHWEPDDHGLRLMLTFVDFPKGRSSTRQVVVKNVRVVGDCLKGFYVNGGRRGCGRVMKISKRLETTRDT